MHHVQLPLRIVRVMWNLLWRKKMVFYNENQPVAECVGFKGLPQGSALSSFLYNFYTSRADRVLPISCSMLQYADYLAVSVSHVHVEIVQRTVQSVCDGLNGVLRNIGLSISESELVLFSRKHILRFA
jgi:hypothetical protein